MNPTGRLSGNSMARLFESQLAPYVDAFGHYLIERRYASSTVDSYLACIAEFGLWMSRSLLDIDGIDDEVVQLFLDCHLVECSNSAAGRSKYCNLRASLSLTKSHLIPRIRWRLTSKTDTRYQKHQSHARFVQNVSEAQYKRE